MVDRRKVLRHHPDKKAAQTGANDDAFFKCIQKGELVPSKGSGCELTRSPRDPDQQRATTTVRLGGLEH